MRSRIITRCLFLLAACAAFFVACDSGLQRRIPGEAAVLLDYYGSRIVPGNTLENRLRWMQANAQSGGNYVIEISGNESIAPQILPNGRINLTLTLRGSGEMRTVGLSSSGNIFRVTSGVTLVLGNNITLQGRGGNNAPLVLVETGGTLIMEEGARITGNDNTGSIGGGVSVEGT
ncbi:MAG: hypothetical protein FWB78_11010, partial [Treponema sp.]|nr:hypothetical protein [Treponema sp.]